MKRNIRIHLPHGESVSAIIQLPDEAWCMMVLAHGAGVGMDHSFMQQIANRFEKAGIATLRFNFLYMEKGGGRPDLPHVAYNVLRAAIAKAQDYSSKETLPLVGAGKSFGGRMFSQLMSAEELPGVSALVFFGFPLHAPGKPGKERADHLAHVKVPMLFLQGTRDTLAQPDLIKEVTDGLRKATLAVIKEGDHSFHVPKKSGMSDAQVLDDLVELTSTWLRKKLT
ncbi:MAG TPA: alpha/beta family hydrolase [Saprospiraceae bacterium]|nr:alpha/beta family hydrolase [Saprospiraceae bacterium]